MSTWGPHQQTTVILATIIAPPIRRRRADRSPIASAPLRIPSAQSPPPSALTVVRVGVPVILDPLLRLLHLCVDGALLLEAASSLELVARGKGLRAPHGAAGGGESGTGARAGRQAMAVARGVELDSKAGGVGWGGGTGAAVQTHMSETARETGNDRERRRAGDSGGGGRAGEPARTTSGK